jgi:hypothetical protein
MAALMDYNNPGVIDAEWGQIHAWIAGADEGDYNASWAMWVSFGRQEGYDDDDDDE